MPTDSKDLDLAKAFLEGEKRDGSQVIMHIRPDLILPHIQSQIDRTLERIETLKREIQNLENSDVSVKEHSGWHRELADPKREQEFLQADYDRISTDYASAYREHKIASAELESLKTQRANIITNQIELERLDRLIAEARSELWKLRGGEGFMPFSRKDRITALESRIADLYRPAKVLQDAKIRYMNINKKIKEKETECQPLSESLVHLSTRRDSLFQDLQKAAKIVTELEEKYKDHKQQVARATKANESNKSATVRDLRLALSQEESKLKKLMDSFDRLIEKVIST